MVLPIDGLSNRQYHASTNEGKDGNQHPADTVRRTDMKALTFIVLLAMTASAFAQTRTCHQTCNRIGAQTYCTQTCN